MLEMHSAQRLKFFLGSLLPDANRNLRVFSISAYSKAFNATYLKPH